MLAMKHGDMSARITDRLETLSRRRLIGGAALLPFAGSLTVPLDALAALAATAGQPLGPFYPTAFPREQDNDLTLAPGGTGRAMGTVIHLSGRVLDLQGEPLPGAVVQIWQTDHGGRYRHPNARGAELLDPNFQGFGWTLTGGNGEYRFVTVKPAPYPGRTPHIHFVAGFPGGTPLVTQMYFPDEPLNRRDGLLNSVRDPALRAALIAEIEDGNDIEAGALRARFDIVLPGRAPA